MYRYKLSLSLENRCIYKYQFFYNLRFAGRTRGYIFTYYQHYLSKCRVIMLEVHLKMSMNVAFK